MKKPTLIAYALNWKQGIFGGGPWHPGLALFVQACLIAAGISGIVSDTIDPPWGVILALVCWGILIGWWIAVWFNWRDRCAQIDRINSNPSRHHPDLWDAAKYTCIHGVKPHKRTLKCAWPIGHAVGTPRPTDEQRNIRIDE